MFIAGNDAEAKASVAALLKRDFGWKNVVDPGDIVGASGMKQFLTLWFRLYGLRGSPFSGVRLVGRPGKRIGSPPPGDIDTLPISP